MIGANGGLGAPLPTYTAPAAKPSAPKPPAAGDVIGGYRFKGGDPNKQESWEAVQ